MSPGFPICKMVVALLGWLQGWSVVFHAPGTAEYWGRVSLPEVLATEGSPEEGGKPSSLPAECGVLGLFLFSRLLEDQKRICLPAPLLSCGQTHNLCLPAWFLPQGGADSRSLVSGPGEVRLFQAGRTRATEGW